MTSYFSTFISGFTDVIEQLVNRDFPDVKITMLLDGLVVYSTEAPLQQVRKTRYFNNTFLLLNQFPITPPGRAEGIVRRLASDVDFKTSLRPLMLARNSSFRLIVSRENQMISVDKGIMRNIEARIISATRLRLGPLKADSEFWFLLRREDQAFLGVRLTGLNTVQKKPEKGEVSRELAYLLCSLSDPQDSDVFLDPFCGSGAIPLERAKSYPYSKIIAGDKDRGLVAALKQRAGIKDFEVATLDATNLASIADQSVDKVVTDPPWGLYDSSGNSTGGLEALYDALLREFCRVIKPGGLVVILTARKELLQDLLKRKAVKKLLLQQTYDILVSGKKAGVYVLKASA
ncbi:MAG: hypothetical protein UZ21_OP11001000250 [Microgenomates bacterium OLB22]|nr:MAG: hypothetical protein UZ21_OP11001000250 [Microgenomates bacterium OLB22]